MPTFFSVCFYATRLMHYVHPWNPLWQMHRLHHAIPIDTLTESLEYKGPKWYYFFWYFDNLHETAEIVLGETLPAVLIYMVDPECGVPLLAFHYLYEIWATDALLEHNASITNTAVISTFAVGQVCRRCHCKRSLPNCIYSRLPRPFCNCSSSLLNCLYLFSTLTPAVSILQPQFHLEHHRNPRTNFGFTLACWDHIFGTFTLPSTPKAATQALSNSTKCPASLDASIPPSRLKAE
jgi:hypothetical protein